MILIFETIIIFFVITGFGILTKKITNIKIETENFTESFFLGIIFLSTLGILLNIFFSLNSIISYFLIFFGLIFNIIFCKKGLKNLFFEGIVLSLFVLLLLSKSKVYDDFGLYHLPLITKLTESNIILGISNIHFRYGHIFSLFYSAALFKNHFMSFDVVHAMMGLIYAVFLLFLFKKIFNKKNSNVIRFLSLFILIYYLCKFYDYGNHGLDVPASIFFFLILIFTMSIIFEKKDENQLFKIFYISFFLITLKISYFFIFFFPLYLLITKTKNNFKFCLKKNFIIIVSFSLWLLTNFLTTSCFLYPKKEFCLETSWSAPEKNWQSSPDEVYTEISAWSKGWVDSFKNRQPPDFKNREEALNHMRSYISGNWVIYYSKHFKDHVIKTIITSILILTILKIFFKIKFKHLQNKSKKNILFILFIIVINIFFWFLTAPLIRFGFAFLISLFFLIFLLFHDFDFNFKNKKAIILCLLAFTIFTTRNLIPDRVNNFNNNYLKPYPNKYSKSTFSEFEYFKHKDNFKNQFKSSITINSSDDIKFLELNYPAGKINLALNSTCHDIPSPCSHFREINFKRVFFVKSGYFKKIFVKKD